MDIRWHSQTLSAAMPVPSVEHEGPLPENKAVPDRLISSPKGQNLEATVSPESLPASRRNWARIFPVLLRTAPPSGRTQGSAVPLHLPGLTNGNVNVEQGRGIPFGPRGMPEGASNLFFSEGKPSDHLVLTVLSSVNVHDPNSFPVLVCLARPFLSTDGQSSPGRA